ncbi:unnamed protein product [Spirodela intermedia]|uniref:Uncharacterized protein n=1 Tax=Spirodela intermedia TaxID=51605 RepID=A0A7I8INW6_SPIIN|nr:unnamed protein product [Spirodela intermedia]CAA6659596.1 unnamed protein product [Spirodela intermedia]
MKRRHKNCVIYIVTHITLILDKVDNKAGAQAAWTDRGTCAPLPFHVTGGQLTVGQGVVVHV